MFPLNDIIKYVGFALIIYFLLKAFADNKLSNKQISLIVLVITILVIIICSQTLGCSKNRIEKFENLESSMPNSNLNKSDHEIKSSLPNETINKTTGYEYTPELAKLLGIDLKKYGQIIDRENDVKDKIRSAYTNDMTQTTTNPLNTVPLGKAIYGYTFLPPENWFRAYDTPPVCHSLGETYVHYSVPKSIEGLLEFDTYTI